jgi:hypothetical protein
MSKILGVHRNTINNWFTTGAADAEALSLMAEHGIDVVYVLQGKRELSASLFSKGVGGGQISVRFAERDFWISPDDYRWIPVMNVKVAGGSGATASAENVVAFNAYRKSWLDEQGLLTAELSEVTITGRSMEPVLPDGKSVLVNHSDTDPQGGSIYVVRQDEDLIAKYLQKLPGGRLQVSSENGAAFPPYEVKESDIAAGSFAIVGRVVPR